MKAKKREKKETERVDDELQIARSDASFAQLFWRHDPE